MDIKENNSAHAPRPMPVYEREPTSPVRRKFLWIFSVIMIGISSVAFAFKLIEFTYSFLSDETVRASIIPVLTYLIVAAGYACMFIWSYLKGHFRDVEGPKYRMLEMQDEFDAAELKNATK